MTRTTMKGLLLASSILGSAGLAQAQDATLTIESWRNDLTAPAVILVPEIADVVGSLIYHPATICSRMSGSGDTTGAGSVTVNSSRAARWCSHSS